MAAADKRVAIKSKTGDQYGHAIEGHIPEGWEKITRAPAKPEPKRK